MAFFTPKGFVKVNGEWQRTAAQEKRQARLDKEAAKTQQRGKEFFSGLRTNQTGSTK